MVLEELKSFFLNTFFFCRTAAYVSSLVNSYLEFLVLFAYNFLVASFYTPHVPAPYVFNDISFIYQKSLILELPFRLSCFFCS